MGDRKWTKDVRFISIRSKSGLHLSQVCVCVKWIVIKSILSQKIYLPAPCKTKLFLCVVIQTFNLWTSFQHCPCAEFFFYLRDHVNELYKHDQKKRWCDYIIEWNEVAARGHISQNQKFIHSLHITRRDHGIEFSKNVCLHLHWWLIVWFFFLLMNLP